MNRWIFASLVGFSAAGFIVGQARRLSLVSNLGVIVLFILLLLNFTLLARWLIDHFVLLRLERMDYSPRVNTLWLAGSLLVGMLLVLAIPVALPRYPAVQTLEIMATGEKNPLAGSKLVKLRGLYGLYGDRASFIDFTEQGKLYITFQTDTTGSQQITMALFAHPIAAHLYFGTPLSTEQSYILGEIRPLDDFWGYRCFSHSPTISSRFSLPTAVQHRRFLLHTFLDLTLRNPNANLRHVICASSLIWRLVPLPNAYLYKHAIIWDSNGKPDYIENNSLNVQDNSLLPSLLERYAQLVRMMDSWLIWRPALYLYLCMFGSAVFVLRRRSWRYSLFVIPALVQSATLALVNVAQDFRFQFAIYLIGFFSLGLMFVARHSGTGGQCSELLPTSNAVETPAPCLPYGDQR